MSRLILMSKTSVQKQVTLLDGVAATLGRGENCSVMIPDPHMSRMHAEVLRKGDVTTVRDLGSSNGTFVNGRRVAQQVLKNGDVVTMGVQEIRFLLSYAFAPTIERMALVTA